MQYCECTNDFVNAIIDDYFNSFEIRKYYINKYEQPYLRCPYLETCGRRYWEGQAKIHLPGLLRQTGNGLHLSC